MIRSWIRPLLLLLPTNATESKLSSEREQMNFSSTMKVLSVLLLLLFSALANAKNSEEVTELQIEVTYKPEKCSIQAQTGDRVRVHYKGSLTDGSVFDSSHDIDHPIEFELGAGHVIQGWEQGVLGMCLGEQRKLKIPAKLGYGDTGFPPNIPGGATLVFDTEVIGIAAKSSSSKQKDDDIDDDITDEL